MSLALIWIRVASYAGYFWFKICLLHGDVNPVCVLCLKFFMHSPRAVINKKSWWSYGQCGVALSSLPSPPWPRAPFQGCFFLLGGCCGVLLSSSPWPCPSLAPAELHPEKILAWPYWHWELCSSARCLWHVWVHQPWSFSLLKLLDWNSSSGAFLSPTWAPLPEVWSLGGQCEVFVSSVQDFWWGLIVLT